MSDEEMVLRNRLIGLAVRQARERAKKTKKECAQALGKTVSAYSACEEGRVPLSLPELEVLAYLLDVPVRVFWDESARLAEQRQELPLQEVLELRQRVVGGLLRQARVKKGLTQKDLAELLGCSTRRIAAYEFGEKPIPLLELQKLADKLEMPLEHFMGDWIGATEKKLEDYQVFQELPKEIRDFVSAPINRSYLDLAIKLAEMPAGALRSIAEGILEITY